VRLTVRYFAGAAAAAGIAQEVVELREDDRVTDLLTTLAHTRGPALARVLDVASVLVDGTTAGPDAPLTPNGTVDVLPPFAGG